MSESPDTTADSTPSAVATVVTVGKPAAERVVMVTGITSGIGRLTAEQLAAKGCTVIAVARDPQRGATAVEEIRAATGSETVELLVGDLALVRDVRALAAKFIASKRPLDGLINNAGVKLATRTVTAEGFETTLAVNHLAPYLLSVLLKDSLVHGGRIVNVNSFMHTRAELDLDDLQSEKSYAEDVAYSRSKLLSLLATYKLARDWEPDQVSVNAYNPGWVRTAMTAGGPSGVVAKLFAKSPRLAAEGAGFVAVSPRVETVTGAYYLASGRMKSSSPVSYDEELQNRVVALTEELLAKVPAPA